MLTFSIFFASILGYALVTYVDHGWQYIQVPSCWHIIEVSGAEITLFHRRHSRCCRPR